MNSQAESLATEVARFRLPQGVAAHDGAADLDFDPAIAAHRQWKVKLGKAVAERTQRDAETSCRDDRCPLGQWIHDSGGRRWGSRPTFAELLGKHAEFHAAAGTVARRINAGAHGDAGRLIGLGSAFARVSNEVRLRLTRAKHGL